MDVDLRRLKYAIAVARTLNFSRAADELAVTQPALSRSIAALEDALGIRIFERGRSGVVITKAGAAVIADAERVLSEARTLEHNAKQWRNADAGYIAFGMGPLMASIFLPRVLTETARTRPNLNIYSMIQPVSELISCLESDRIEFFLTVTDVAPSADHLSTYVIGQDSLGYFVRVGHPLASRCKINLKELSQYPILASPGNYDGTESNPAGHLPPKIICENFQIIKEVTFASDSICLGTPSLFHAELADGRATELAIDIAPIVIKICVVRLANRAPSPAGKLVLDLIKQFCKHPA